MSARAIEHAALQWHTAYAHRMALYAERLKLSKNWPESRGYPGVHPTIARYWAVKAEITAAKTKERAALKLLAKACAEQRGHLASADVIDVDVKQLGDATAVASSTTRESK